MFLQKNNSIPSYQTYFPSVEDMDRDQLRFYRKVKSSLAKGKFIEVDGNISYVFTFLYELLGKWNAVGFESLSDYLIHISELYSHEEKLSSYCLFWAHDCLLGLGHYDEYLTKSEHGRVFGTLTHKCNLRLNIQQKLGRLANPTDLLLIANGRKTKFIANNQGLYKSKIIEVFNGYAGQNGEWFAQLEDCLKDQRHSTHEHGLFSGAPMQAKPKLGFKIRAYYSASEILQTIKSLAREAENTAREELGIPKIGEGWVSETELFNNLKQEFSQTLVVQHGQPSWLGRQHYDIWFPHWKIAVEYHGLQHFEPVEFFGGEDAFAKNVERDKRKIRVSVKNGVKLFVVKEGYDLEKLLAEIQVESTKKSVSAPHD